MWVARLHSNDEIIACGATYLACQAAADETELWEQKPGSVAPYYFTTCRMVECTLCISGVCTEYDLSWPCPQCGGIGFIALA